MAPSNCTVCNKPPTDSVIHQECAGCKSAAYCSKVCQKEDWPIHKLVCSQFKTFNSDPKLRPSPSHKLAILLPVDGEEPKLFWADCQMQNGQFWETPEYSKFLGDDDPYPERILVSAKLKVSNPGLKRFALEHTVGFHRREMSMEDGSLPNKCVIAMMKGKHKYNWKGPLAIFSQPGTKSDPLVYQDVVPADLRVVIDFFPCYGDGVGKDEGMQLKGGIDDLKELFPSLSKDSGTIYGVDISSKGDQEILNKVKFIEVEISPTHPIFKYTKPTSISIRMGLPILVRKHGNLPHSWIAKGDQLNINPFENCSALFLNMNANPKSDSWGYADIMEWDLDIGTVLVVRADRKAISEQQVEALARFYHDELLPGMQVVNEDAWAIGNVKNKAHWKVKEEWIKTHMCREKFEEFFEKFKAEKLAAGDGAWEYAMSPYEV
jgi:hypothetical protein